MRRLSPRVNVIPVVGKADSLTPDELHGFKKRVSKTRRCGYLEVFAYCYTNTTDHGRHRTL